MSANNPTKAAVSVSEMARMVGLSRARFYQLMKAGVFPQPLHAPSKKRPYFDEELQITCLEVRRRNCGVNGEPVLFYDRRKPVAPARKNATTTPKKAQYADLLDSLKGLGMVGVTEAQADAALRELFPKGTQAMPEVQLIRTVFLHLKRKSPSDRVGP